MNIQSMENIMASLGDFGGDYITDTNAHTPDSGHEYFAIKATTDTTISAVVGNINVAGLVIYTGDVVFGKWSSITLTSGNCIAYQKVKG